MEWRFLIPFGVQMTIMPKQILLGSAGRNQELYHLQLRQNWIINLAILQSNNVEKSWQPVTVKNHIWRGYERRQEGKKARKGCKGCKGLEYCGKAHWVDAMEILDSIWDADDNYTKADSIRQCWKKSGALSPTAKADMNNEIGSFSMSEKKKIISNEESMELCALLSASTTKYQQLREFPLLKECLAEEEMLTMTELPKNINY